MSVKGKKSKKKGSKGEKKNKLKPNVARPSDASIHQTLQRQEPITPHQPTVPAVRRRWRSWLKPDRALFYFIAGTALALFIAYYAARPAVSPSLSDQMVDVTNHAIPRISVTNTGAMTMRDVTVECLSNKAVFADKYTLELHRYVLMQEYAAATVNQGESFTAACPQAWFLYMNKTDGFFAFGEVSEEHSSLGIPFTFKYGPPTLLYSTGTPVFVRSDLVGYTNYPSTSLDGTLIIKYKFSLFGIRQERRVHLVGFRSAAVIVWKIAPESEAVIPDAPLSINSFKLTASVPDKGAAGVVYKAPAGPNDL